MSVYLSNVACLPAMLVRLVLVACTVSLLAACGPLARREIDTDDTNARRYAETGDLKAEIDELAEPLIADKQTPGLVAGVLLPDGSKKIFG